MEPLPSYTPEVLPRYDLTPSTSISPSTRPGSPVSFLDRARSHSNYQYRSERMHLDLGARKWGTKLPAYGRAGQIEGTLTVRSFRHAERIVVRLIGKLNASHVVNQIPTISQTHTIMHKSIQLWSSDAASSSAHQTVFPFAFTLESEGCELPPSATIQLSRAQASVAYAVRVDMYRRGIHMHETLQTEVLYLPRTTSRYCRPFIPESGNEKRPRISDHEWHTSALSLEPIKPGKSRPALAPAPVPELLLPQDLSYPSGQSIPFILSLSASNPDVNIQLVRTSGVQTRAGLIQQTHTISHGRIHTRSPGHDRTTVHGTLETGQAEQEASWRAGVAWVSHEVRVEVGSGIPGVIWKLVKRIELTTHEWRGERASEMPALGSGVTSRTAVHLINMSV